MVTFLQRTFTSLVHAHAGRTQLVGVRTYGAGTVTLHSFLATFHRPTTKALCAENGLGNSNVSVEG